MAIMKIASEKNISDPFTKILPAKTFEGHLEDLGLRDMSYLFYGKWEIVRVYALKACIF